MRFKNGDLVKVVNTESPFRKQAGTVVLCCGDDSSLSQSGRPRSETYVVEFSPRTFHQGSEPGFVNRVQFAVGDLSEVEDGQ